MQGVPGDPPARRCSAPPRGVQHRRSWQLLRLTHAGWHGRCNPCLITLLGTLQRPCVHEGLAVHWVDGPPRVPRLPPAGHSLRLQLPHLRHERRLSHMHLTGVLMDAGPLSSDLSMQPLQALNQSAGAKQGLHRTEADLRAPQRLHRPEADLRAPQRLETKQCMRLPSQQHLAGS